MGHGRRYTNNLLLRVPLPYLIVCNAPCIRLILWVPCASLNPIPNISGGDFFKSMISPQRFDIFFSLTEGCSEGLDAFKCLLLYSKSMDQSGKVANPARGQVNRKMNIPQSYAYCNI